MAATLRSLHQAWRIFSDASCSAAISRSRASFHPSNVPPIPLPPCSGSTKQTELVDAWAVGLLVPPDAAVSDRALVDLRDDQVARGVAALEVVVAGGDAFERLGALVALGARPRVDDPHEVRIVRWPAEHAERRPRRAAEEQARGPFSLLVALEDDAEREVQRAARHRRASASAGGRRPSRRGATSPRRRSRAAGTGRNASRHALILLRTARGWGMDARLRTRICSNDQIPAEFVCGT